ncbi:MAG: hypothetical protein SNJ71_01975, partial [Bacteroidales bacterium]
SASYIGNAVIVGSGYIDADKSEKPNKDEPAGKANVRISWNNGDLSIVSDSDKRVVSKSIETKGDGTFEFIVSTTDKGVEFTIDADQFKSSYKYEDFDKDGNKITVTKEGIFPKQSKKVTVKKGEKVYVELNYGAVPEIVLTK